MKILIVNTYDKGGAANACLRLYKGLLGEGVDASVLFKSKRKNIPNSGIATPKKEGLTTFQKGINKFKRIFIELKLIKPKQKITNPFLKARNQNLELFSYPTSNYDITESPLYKEADIINLHWVAGLLDYESFFKKNTKPVVWTLHDMNPFTGGEHYREHYDGINDSGLIIKRKVNEIEKVEFKKIITLKKSLINNIKNLTVVAPSKWLTEEAKNSEVFKNKKCFCIPHGLDKEIFKPRNKEYSREILGIPKDKKVMLFVADSISNYRKGFVFLQKAFKQLDCDNVVLCAIGSKNTSLESIDNIIELGAIFDERLMSIAYSAADVFVIPSLMDNLPNTVLESIMCGTPVIGFPIGGIPDMIQDGVNGLLTKDISVSSLVETIKLFLNTTDQFDSNKIRENAVKKYDQKIQADNYIKLFEGIFKNKL